MHPGLLSRILYTWSAIYHSSLSQGEDFIVLRPVISIRLLNESLFDKVAGYHLPFILWNRENHVMLTDHLQIHLLQLPLWHADDVNYQEIDRWMCLFNEGKNLDTDHPPSLLATKEMKQAMKVLQQFAENQADYLLYQQRMERLSVEASWKNAIERAQQEAERERLEKERLLAILKKAGIDPDQSL